MPAPERTFEPYAPPNSPSSVSIASTEELTYAQRKLIKDFRSQSVPLGVLWLIMSGLFGWLLGYRINVDGLGWNNTPLLAAIVFTLGIIFTVGCAVSGVGTLLKMPWAIRLGLGMSYLSIPFLGGSTIIFTVIVIVQAHRVLSFISKLRKEGIPLSTKLPKFVPYKQGPSSPGNKDNLSDLFG